jgi:hypothetical protein
LLKLNCLWLFPSGFLSHTWTSIQFRFLLHSILSSRGLHSATASGIRFFTGF